MTDHLAECPKNWSVPGDCACELLRACEQRVEETWSAIAGQDQYAKGYTAGLDAAREAVAGLRSAIYNTATGPAVWREDTLAAIDALREKP